MAAWFQSVLENLPPDGSCVFVSREARCVNSLFPRSEGARLSYLHNNNIRKVVVEVVLWITENLKVHTELSAENALISDRSVDQNISQPYGFQHLKSQDRT